MFECKKCELSSLLRLSVDPISKVNRDLKVFPRVFTRSEPPELTKPGLGLELLQEVERSWIGERRIEEKGRGRDWDKGKSEQVPLSISLIPLSSFSLDS